MRLFIALIIIVYPLSGYAGWFGPSTYEECVIDGMKGVTSNVAAVAIAQACRSKFPLPPEPPPKPKSAEELAKEKEQKAKDCHQYRQRQAQAKREIQEYDEAVQNYIHRKGPMPFGEDIMQARIEYQKWSTAVQGCDE